MLPRRILVALLLAALSVHLPQRAHAADVLCKKKKTGVVTVRAARCGKKEVQVDLTAFGAAGPAGAPGATGSTGPAGADGAAGAAGADGQLRIYGDGDNDGDGDPDDLIVTGSASLPAGSYKWRNITVTDTGTLQVTSGNIIRCSGTFDNQGTILVASGALGAKRTAFSSNTRSTGLAPAGAGISRQPAGSGEFGGNGFRIYGGPSSSEYMAAATASSILKPPSGGGGGGAGAGEGGSGGGSLVVLAAGALSNSGIILAAGNNGSSSGGGGGAGGVIVLASAVSISVTGSLQAFGGNGGQASANSGAGGGGGGGIVNLISPSITAPGAADGFNINVDGGDGRSGGEVTVATAYRTGGGAGGNCAGVGGAGGDVAASTDGLANYAYGSSDGMDGSYNRILVDPTPLF